MTTVTYLRTNNMKKHNLDTHVVNKTRLLFLDWFFSLSQKDRKRLWQPRDIAIILNIPPKEIITTMLALGWIAQGTFKARWAPPKNVMHHLSRYEELLAYCTMLGQHPFIEQPISMKQLG